VLKLIALGAEDARWPARVEPADTHYWRREPLAYASGVLNPFGVPRCRAIVDRADGSVALWLDDGGAEPRTRGAEELGEIAFRLGRAQARLLGIEGEWLVPGFLREYLRLHGVDADERALARLDALPQTLCHNDFHPANVLADGSVIDWAYCGIGAIGLDAGVLVVDGFADGAFPPDEADDVADAVWDGYTRGLGRADDDVRFGFVQGASRLRWLPRATSFIERLASES
jgi:hypothetical protein